MPFDLVQSFPTILTTTITAIVAAVISFLAGRGLKSHEWRLELTKERMMARERLYADFLTVVTSHALRAKDEKLSKVASLTDVMEKNERIALVASQPVVEAAKALCTAILDMNTVGESAGTDGFFDLKQEFIRQVRSELAALEK